MYYVGLIVCVYHDDNESDLRFQILCIREGCVCEKNESAWF